VVPGMPRDSGKQSILLGFVRVGGLRYGIRQLGSGRGRRSREMNLWGGRRLRSFHGPPMKM
jgi:hypothetical protein